ncbi:cGMP-dependent 3',5'-cyclic phosphodiesterase, partial [Ophiophagus hannah]
VSDDEHTKLLHEGITPVSQIDPNFAKFTYTPRSLPEDDTSMVSHSEHAAGHEFHQQLQNRPSNPRQVLPHGKKGVQRPSLSQLDTRLLRLPLLLPAVQESGAHQLSGVSGQTPFRSSHRHPEHARLQHLRSFLSQVGYDPANKQHHSLLLYLLMTSCDLSDQTKGWKTTRKIAEKAMGNRPMEMMDREKAYIPELQISFMEHIAMPIYNNREHWTKVSHKFTLRGLPSNNSLDFLDEEYDLQTMAEKDGLKMNGCLDGEDGHGESEL